MPLTEKAERNKDAGKIAELQHRHFATIATILRRLPPDCYGPEQVARHFAEHLGQTNPRFDDARFLRACGVEE